MKNKSLLQIFPQSVFGNKISDELENVKCKIHLKGFIGSSKSILAASIIKHAKSPQLFILNDKETATYFINDLENKKQLSETVMYSWINTAPEKAANWYLNQSDDSNKQKSVNKVIDLRAMRNPNDTLDWLQRQEGVSQQKSLVKLLNSTTNKLHCGCCCQYVWCRKNKL